MIEAGAFDVSFSYEKNMRAVHALLDKYSDYPMDFADACVVCMAEIHGNARVLTVDKNDFSVYRMRRNRAIDYVAPE